MLGFPILLDEILKPKEVLNNAIDVLIKDQLLTTTNGFETIEIKIPSNDEKAMLIQNEDYIEVNGRHYIVRLCVTDKTDENLLCITCDATWYDFNDFEPITELKRANIGPKIVMGDILSGTGWSVGEVDITTPHDFNITEITTRLSALRQLPQIYGGELSFDTKNKKVNLMTQVGTQTDILFAYNSNMEEVHKSVDTRNLKTRLYLTGKGGITIAPVNGGLAYVENYSHYDSLGKERVLKVANITDDRFSNPNYMKAWMVSKLATMCKPDISYTVKVSLLGGVIPELGDYVGVYDEELNLKQQMRVMGRTINVLDPEESDIQLEGVTKSLADQIANASQNGGNVADVQDALESVMSDMTMFNLLFNSRADDGFAYWINQGFTIDNTAGVSGSSGFAVQGQLATTKTLSQTVDVANRENYTLSADVEINNVNSGTTAKVGFDVIFEYEDGTTETQYVSILDTLGG